MRNDAFDFTAQDSKRTSRVKKPKSKKTPAESVSQRYKDAYRVARFIDSMGDLFKAGGVILGIIVSGLVFLFLAKLRIAQDVAAVGRLISERICSCRPICRRATPFGTSAVPESLLRQCCE